MNRSNTRTLLAALFALPMIAAAFFVVPGCNTVEGAGEDVEAVGEGVSEASRDVRR